MIIPYTIKTCYHCGNATWTKVVADYRHEFNHLLTFHWKLLFCPVCNNISLEKTIFNRADYTPVSGDITPEKVIVYPAVSSNLSVPPKILSAYESALKTRNIDGFMCAMALRRTLEMVCKDKGQATGSLFVKLQNLANQGVLPPILDQMASVLRELGNVAAHADDIEFPNELIPDLIAFIEVILNYLYVLPGKIEDIQSKIGLK